MKQEEKLKKKQLQNIEIRRDYKRPPSVYEKMKEESQGDLTTQVKTSSRNLSIDRRGANSSMDNPYHSDMAKLPSSEFKHKRKSVPMSTETSERTEKFNVRHVLHQRNERIKKYSKDYGIQIIDIKEFNQVRNIRSMKEQQKLREMKQLKELKSALVPKQQSPIDYRLRSRKHLQKSQSPSEAVKIIVSEQKKNNKRKKKRLTSADEGSFLPPI